MKTYYALHIRQTDKSCDWIGEVIGSQDGILRIQIIDAVLGTGCGIWELTSEVKDVPKKECRMFLDNINCLEAGIRINNYIFQRKANQ